MCFSLLLLLMLINISVCELGIRASQFDYYITSGVVFTPQLLISRKGFHMEVREAVEEFLQEHRTIGGDQGTAHIS
jgi:hypothetical protein